MFSWNLAINSVIFEIFAWLPKVVINFYLLIYSNTLKALYYKILKKYIQQFLFQRKILLQITTGFKKSCKTKISKNMNLIKLFSIENFEI